MASPVHSDGLAKRLWQETAAQARRLASGQYRRSLAALAPTITGSALGQRLAGATMWLAAPLGGMGPNWDPSDMIVTVEAEDVFDVSNRLQEISAPTLVIGGERDASYSRELFEETTRGIQDARLFIYEGRGQGGAVTDRRFARDVKAFLLRPGGQRRAEIIPNTNT